MVKQKKTLCVKAEVCVKYTNQKNHEDLGNIWEEDEEAQYQIHHHQHQHWNKIDVFIIRMTIVTNLTIWCNSKQFIIILLTKTWYNIYIISAMRTIGMLFRYKLENTFNAVFVSTF